MEDLEGKKLKFLGYVIEVFFFIFVYLSKDLGSMSGGVFDGEQMVEGKVGA